MASSVCFSKQQDSLDQEHRECHPEVEVRLEGFLLPTQRAAFRDRRSCEEGPDSDLEDHPRGLGCHRRPLEGCDPELDPGELHVDHRIQVDFSAPVLFRGA